ncbi:hypothetical protein ABFS82_10G154100 [Erythranthe guttata]
MKPAVFVMLGAFLAFLLISFVAANDPTTNQIKDDGANDRVVDDQKQQYGGGGGGGGWGGSGGGGWGGRGGGWGGGGGPGGGWGGPGGGWGGGNCRWGRCCGGNYYGGCRCCYSAQEALANMN